MWSVCKDAGITDYTYRFQRLCFCSSFDPVILDVQDGVVVSVEDATTGVPIIPHSDDIYLTIDGIFEAIQDAEHRNAHSLTVEYHPTLGYPTAVDIDYDLQMIDDEMSLRASDLQAK
jgi:hypothetical protein